MEDILTTEFYFQRPHIFCLCHFCFLIPNKFTSQSSFLALILWPITSPIIKALPYPITTNVQSISIEDLEYSGFSLKVKGGDPSHFLDTMFPHNPKFSSNELFRNVSNWFPRGMDQSCEIVVRYVKRC